MTKISQSESIVDSEKRVSRVLLRWLEMGALDASPLYTRLAQGIVEDRKLSRLAAHSQPSQPPPNMLFAAVQYLLAQDKDAPLRDFYAQFCEQPRSVEDAFPLFRAYCLDNSDRLIPIIATRRTQTNAIGRSQFLTLAFQEASNGKPMSIIEVGCSAGLNLNWSRFGYDFGDWGRVGDEESPVQLMTAWRGEKRPIYRAELPTVTGRVGIDVNPLDVRNENDVRWLDALIWPEHHARREQLRNAIIVAKQHPPTLQRGDLFDLLPTAVRIATPATQLIIFGSFVLYQLAVEQRKAFHLLLDEIAREREICWISAEWLGGASPQLTLARWKNGVRETKLLANVEAHGRWIEWV